MNGFDRDEWFTAAWRPSGAARRAGFAGVFALHITAALAWWQMPPSSAPHVPPPRLVATIVSVAPPERPPERKHHVVARPAAQKPRAVPPVAVASAQDTPAVPTPAAIAVPAAAVALAAPTAPVEVAVAPAPVEAAPAPPPIVAPRFDASYLDNARPAYPSIARQFREQGVVMLNVRVAPTGLPDAIEVRLSSGSARLDEAARKAVLRWRFVPARQGDTPVTAWVVVPTRFALNG